MVSCLVRGYLVKNTLFREGVVTSVALLNKETYIFVELIKC